MPILVAATGSNPDFLLPNLTFIPEAIVFLVLLWLIAKYILPPVNKALETRKTQIAESLEVIEQAKTTEAEARVRADAMLAEARQAARTQVEQATRLGEELREELRQRGREEYERTLARARTEMERATQRATDELRRSVADLVVAASAQVIGRELDAELHRALIEQAIGEVETSA